MSYFAINPSFGAAWLKNSGVRIAARARLISRKLCVNRHPPDDGLGEDEVAAS
jgi:hypothetical protein